MSAASFGRNSPRESDIDEGDLAMNDDEGQEDYRLARTYRQLLDLAGEPAISAELLPPEDIASGLAELGLPPESREEVKVFSSFLRRASAGTVLTEADFIREVHKAGQQPSLLSTFPNANPAEAVRHEEAPPSPRASPRIQRRFSANALSEMSSAGPTEPPRVSATTHARKEVDPGRIFPGIEVDPPNFRQICQSLDNWPDLVELASWMPRNRSGLEPLVELHEILTDAAQLVTLLINTFPPGYLRKVLESLGGVVSRTMVLAVHGSEHVEELINKAGRCEEDALKFDANSKQMKAELNTQSNEIRSLREDLQKVESEAKRSKDDYGRQEDNLQRYRSEAQKHQIDSQRLDAENAHLASRVQALEEEANNKDKHLARQGDELNKYCSELQKYQTESQRLEKKNRRLTADLKVIEEEALSRKLESEEKSRKLENEILQMKNAAGRKTSEWEAEVKSMREALSRKLEIEEKSRKFENEILQMKNEAGRKTSEWETEVKSMREAALSLKLESEEKSRKLENEILQMKNAAGRKTSEWEAEVKSMREALSEKQAKEINSVKAVAEERSQVLENELRHQRSAADKQSRKLDTEIQCLKKTAEERQAESVEGLCNEAKLLSAMLKDIQNQLSKSEAEVDARLGQLAGAQCVRRLHQRFRQRNVQQT